MLSKPQRYNYSAGVSNVISRLRATKFGGLSRLFPLLSSLKQSTRPKAEWTREFRVEPEARQFIVLIFVSYKGWKHKTRSGELKDMELTAVRNDPRIILDHLNYRHDDKTRCWYFVMDFDFEYTDWSGVTKKLHSTAMPTKNNILRTIREATRKGGSGFIHVGAHCMYEVPGTSRLHVRARTATYEEIEREQTGTKTAYFFSSDGQRIIGTEFHSCLSDNPDVGGDVTLTLSFDMCNADAFLRDVLDLPYDYTTVADSASQTTAVEIGRTRKQLVVISSALAGQSSGSLQNPGVYKGLVGAVTFLMMDYLGRDRRVSPVEVLKYLNGICIKRQEEHLRQSPRIASRYPISGPLRLLPPPTATS